MYEAQTEAAIKQRMLDAVPSDIDRREGSFVQDTLSPAAIELALNYIELDKVLTLGFAETTRGEYLKMRAAEHGIIPNEAVKATGEITTAGTVGATVPLDSIFSTTTGIQFKTTVAATIGVSGTVAASIEAVVAGISGNVPAGTITQIPVSIPGVTSVTNAAELEGGLDAESDTSLLARYLQRVRSPAAGGNIADYERWALEVPGVGAVVVLPVKYGPGTVSVAILDTDKEPAGEELIGAAQEYIAPLWITQIEAESMTIGGYGVSVDGTAIKMLYSASGNGLLTHTSELGQAGIWKLIASVKVDSIAGTDSLLQIGVYDATVGAWVKTTPSGGVDALTTIKASDLQTSYSSKTIEFFWNGIDEIELRTIRLTADTATITWVDKVTYKSTFSKDTGEGQAPINHRVTVEPVTSIAINISATLVITAGYVSSTVKAAVTENIKAYIKSLVFTADNDVRYVRVGNAILDTAGVTDYSNLLVNSGTANIPVGVQEVAVLGTVTLT